MNDTKFSALLIRLPLGGGVALTASLRRSLRAAGVGFELEPLFTTALPRAGRRVAAASGGWEGILRDRPRKSWARTLGISHTKR